MGENTYVLWVGIVVGETAAFRENAERFLSEEQVAALIDRLARNPEEGVIIPGTGGIRKIRVAAGGKGKRGGARVIYWYYNDEIPLYLLAVYAKNQKVDLSPREKVAMKRLVKEIVRSFEARKRKRA